MFYGEVQLVGGRGVLLQLTNACGPEVVTELVSSGFLKVIFQPNVVVVRTQNAGLPEEVYEPGLIEADHLTPDRVVPELFLDTLVLLC